MDSFLQKELFSTEEVTKNITAVVGKYPKSPRGPEFDFVINPFCYKIINDPSFIIFLKT